MKLVPLASILLAMVAGCSRPAAPPWQSALAGGSLVSRDHAAIFAFTYNAEPDHSVVFYFPFEVGCSTSHDLNSAARTFNYSGTIENLENKTQALKYEISSANPAAMTCNGAAYDLAAGTVFRVDADGKLSQLPFVGLKPTEEYLETLRKYFEAGANSQEGGER